MQKLCINRALDIIVNYIKQLIKKTAWGIAKVGTIFDNVTAGFRHVLPDHREYRRVGFIHLSQLCTDISNRLISLPLLY